MDNDILVVKKIKNIIKKYRFKFNYYDKHIYNNYKGNEIISELINSRKPFMVARGGAVEMNCVREYLSTSFNGVFSNRIKTQIKNQAGVFPTTDETLNKFCKEYIDSMSRADILAVWGVGAEHIVIDKYCENSKLVELRSLEPYYFEKPWSKELQGKTVLIVHPFKESIIKQYKKKSELFRNKDILPDFKELKCIKAIQSNADAKTGFETWFEALEYMKKEISKTEFDIAIIGAGAYGLPLASYIKSIGKQAIQMSGATQILFGIKGMRWDNHEFISNLYNDYWVRPLEAERPKNSEKVEGGSYW